MTRTKGDLIVEEIKIGDVHYEYDLGMEIKSTVISLPQKEERDDDVYWTWESQTDSGEIINYGVSSTHAHYGPNIYTYQAYRKF